MFYIETYDKRRISMSKTMCKTKDAEKRAKKQDDPKFECSKCGKKVNKEKYVCKPEKL
jgi:hypothetical protein